jgi:hypothetical protein
MSVSLRTIDWQACGALMKRTWEDVQCHLMSQAVIILIL